jgi:hypothetical protein
LALRYDWGESIGERNAFYFHEQYAQGEEGFAAHAASPHFAAWERFASTSPSPFSRPPEVNKFLLRSSSPKSVAPARAL